MITVALSIMRDVDVGVEVEPDRDRQPRRHRAHAAEQLALAVVRVLGDHRAVEREERGVAAAAHRADDRLGHVLVGGLLGVSRRMRAARDRHHDLGAGLLRDAEEPAELRVGVAELLDRGRPGQRAERRQRVGTGENVLLSCIIIATTIFRRAMWSVLSPGVPAAATPQSYTRAARLDRVAPAAHSRRRPARARGRRA